MRKDRLNHNAQNYRTFMSMLFVALFVMFAYYFINFESLTIFKNILIVFGIAVTALGIVGLTLKNVKDLKELEKLD